MHRLWSLWRRLVVVLPCQMTQVVTGPRTFLLFRKNWKICCLRRIRCLSQITGHGAERERGLAQCFAGFVALDTTGLRELGVAIALRVGDGVCISHSCRCCGRMESRGLHGLSCKYSADRFPRHSAINDVVKCALQKFCQLLVLEPLGLDRGDESRSDGITVLSFSGGRNLVLGLHVCWYFCWGTP